jgi:hypothetical protein
MIQDTLAQPSWVDTLTVEDKRGLTPLIWARISPTARSASR